MHSPLARCWRQLGCRVVPSGEYLRACLLLLLGMCFVSGKLAILDAKMMDANGEGSAGVGDERSQQEEGSGGWAGRDGRYVWSEEIASDPAIVRVHNLLSDEEIEHISINGSN